MLINHTIFLPLYDLFISLSLPLLVVASHILGVLINITDQTLKLKLFRIPHLLTISHPMTPTRQPRFLLRFRMSINPRSSFLLLLTLFFRNVQERTLYRTRRTIHDSQPHRARNETNTPAVCAACRTHLFREGNLAIRFVVGPGVLGVDVKEDIDEEVEEKGDRVEDEDVGDVGDVGGGEEGHLFLGGAHEEEAGGVQELRIGLVYEEVIV